MSKLWDLGGQTKRKKRKYVSVHKLLKNAGPGETSFLFCKINITPLTFIPQATQVGYNIAVIIKTQN